MSLTGTPLLVLLITLTVAAPLLLVITWQRRPRGVPGAATRFVGIVVCQALAVATLGVVANTSFGFYNSWADLTGSGQAPPQAATSNGLVPADGSLGTVITLAVPQSGPVERGSTRDLETLVWLPPQYDAPQDHQTRFPVTMMLPGQPGTPEGVFKQFDFARAATTAIAEHHVAPFVAVFPPIMVAPPRDTECTDVPDGPQAETWLWKDVRSAVIAHLRVTDDPLRWSAMGWSTGGFCAAKLLLRHRQLFHAAVGFGAYYDSETDKTTGRLFGHSQQLRNENSPLWLIQQPPIRPTNLLIVVSKHDRDSYGGVFYADSQTMIEQTAGIPGVATIVLPTGGHNYRVYGPTLPQALIWLSRTAGL